MILGEEPRLTALDVAESSGAEVDLTRRLWRALGFPELRGEMLFTDADATAVTTLVGIVETGVVDLDTALNMTRAVGQTMARLADWETAAVLPKLLLKVDDTEGSRLDAAVVLLSQMGGPFEELLIYAWRRHLAAAVARAEALGANDEELTTAEVTVGFADLVSFTALSNEMSEDRIGDLVEIFESRVHDVIAQHRGRAIKSLGDSVLFVNEDPVARAGHRRRDHRRDRPRQADARRTRRTGLRLGRRAPRRRVRAAGQPGCPAHHRGPPQPGDHRRGDGQECCRHRSSRPGRCRRARSAGSGSWSRSRCAGTDIWPLKAEIRHLYPPKGLSFCGFASVESANF